MRIDKGVAMTFFLVEIVLRITGLLDVIALRVACWWVVKNLDRRRRRMIFDSTKITEWRYYNV